MGEVMNEQIKELAEQAGFAVYGWNENEFKKFAALVAAHEREACCSIVYGLCESDNVAQRIVDAIRARGTT
jgi:hypothetical protein